MKKSLERILLITLIIAIAGVFTTISTAEAADTIYCTSCGKQIDTGSKFCMYCGHKIANSQESLDASHSSVTGKTEQTGIFDPLSAIMDNGYNPTWDTAYADIPKNVIQLGINGFVMTTVTLADHECNVSIYYDDSNNSIKSITLQAKFDAAVVEEALKNSEFFDHEENIGGILLNYYMQDGSKWSWLQKSENGFNINITPEK